MFVVVKTAAQHLFLWRCSNPYCLFFVMNTPPTGPAAVVGNSVPGGVGSSMWINKLKIVGSGQNWAVAPCEPFYLMGTEPPTPDAALTGAKNLIEHYGLANAYQKFCSKPLREELSAFLPHISGNVDVPASADGSGLMALIERPPIRGKDIRPFAPAQLEHAFRLHPGPLPQEYAALFAAAPPPKHSHRNIDGQPDGVASDNLCSNSGSRLPASAAPGLSGPGSYPRRRRRYEVHRGLASVNSASGASQGGLSSFFPTPASVLASSGSAHNAAPLSAQAHGAPSTTVSSTFPSNSSTETTPLNAPLPPMSKPMDLPPGLIPVSTQASQSNIPLSSVEQPPPPPPLLAPVHQPLNTPNQRHSNTPGSGSFSSDQGLTGSSISLQNIPAPPLLHSIHTSGSGSATPTSQPHYYGTSHPVQSHTGMLQPGEGQNFSKLSSPSVGGSSSSPPSPDPHKIRRLDAAEEERRKRKRKEKKKRKERE